MVYHNPWAPGFRIPEPGRPPTPPPHPATIPIAGPRPGYEPPATPSQLIDNPTGRLICANCTTKGAQMIPCTACECVFYCSPRCRVTHSTAHKLFCPSLALAQDPAVMTSGPLAGLEGRYDEPFSRLAKKRFFEGMPEHDVFVLLIDMYRLMVHDERWPWPEPRGERGQDLGEPVVKRGEMAARPRMFFAALGAKAREGLPRWWGPDCVRRIMEVGMEERGNFHYLGRWVTVRMVANYYGHPLMPLQLRMLLQVLTGRKHWCGVDMMPLLELCVELEGCDEAKLFLKQRNDRLGV